MKRWKKLAGLALTFAMVASIAAPQAYGASKKKIGSISLNITADITPETKYGDEEIEVEIKTGKCTYDYYEIENVGFEWEENDVPEITIYLNAEEGYYFSLNKASLVKLNGATYVNAVKQNASETLALTVKLPSLAESVGEVTAIQVTAGGFAIWEPARGAGSYEVRLYRNGGGIGVSILTTTETYYDFTQDMDRQGSYHVRVRPVNKINTEKKGPWIESSPISITAEMAAAIKDGSAVGMPVRGTWKQTESQWWYEHQDGSYTKNNWEEIDGKWFFFDELGYMRTGWIDWQDKMFYCDLNTGEMLKNTTTPDGYILGADGSRKTGR